MDGWMEDLRDGEMERTGGRCMVVTDVLISGLCGGGDGCFGSAGRVVSVMPCRSCRVGHVVSLMSCRVVSLVSHLGR